MSINKIGLIGATGNLGPAILKGLLDGGFEVTILTREGSNSTDSLTSHPKQKIAKVNFENVNSLTEALRSVEGLVSNVASHALLSQKNVIDAAIKAGIKRFLPSDFGSDMSTETNRSVPFNQPKFEIHQYIEEKIKTHPDFTYTYVYTGPFFDWCLKVGLFVDLQKHEATLWDGGDTKVSVTTLASVGKTVAGIFKNLEATKNKEINVADTTISQKQIIAITKGIDGKEWTTKPGNTAEVYQTALDEMKKPQPNMETLIYGQLFRVIFSPEHGPDVSHKLRNDLVGLPTMTEEQVKAVIKSLVA